MAPSDEPPALAYIERTLADSYRKEIDQEENVWRSLPFFAATLALQLAALFRIVDKLPDPATNGGWFPIASMGVAGALTLVSLCYLAASIYPQKFDYVAKEPALLTYAETLIEAEVAQEGHEQDGSVSALVTLKTEISRQCARAADHNRQINKRRERRRSIAGLAALGSVLMTVLLVGLAYAHYLSSKVEQEHAHAASRSFILAAPEGGKRTDQGGPSVQGEGAGPPANASRH